MHDSANHRRRSRDRSPCLRSRFSARATAGAMRRHSASFVAITLSILIGLIPSPLQAEARPGRVSATLTAPQAHEGGGLVQIEADRMEQSREGDAMLEGDVVLTYGPSRIHADRIRFRAKRFVEAEGNVLIVWGPNRIGGSRMTYDLDLELGWIEDAVGQVEPEFFFSAARAETIGRDQINLESASVTTCTQPVPYWSFSVSSAKIRVDHYAQLFNVRLKAGVVPVFYLPYVLWPVKRDRAAGLLLPEFGSSSERGFFMKDDLFVPLGESADLTLFGVYYEKAGIGGGGDFRIVPDEKGFASLSGFYIDDAVSGAPRYRVSLHQAQDFQNGFRMVTDINQVSDFDFFTDFEPDLKLASSPTILGRVEFTRNGAWTSVNVRDLRREQLFFAGGTLVQRTLPEVEWRGRSRKLARSPFYLSFESSAAWIQQYAPQSTAEYYRGDVFPRLSAAISPFPWLDITPEIAYRGTYYTQHKAPFLGPTGSSIVVDEPLTRSVASGRVEIVGPKFSRIFRKDDSTVAPSYKHTVETRVAYTFQQGAKRSDEVLLYDDVDTVIPAQNFLTYGIRTRLFTRRPRAAQPLVPATYERIVMPDGSSSSAPFVVPEESAEASPGAAEKMPAEPLEIMSFELQQRRSLDEDLNRADLDGDGVFESSLFSPVELTGRFRPSETTDVNLRASYDPLRNEIANVSVSGGVRTDLFRTNFSLVRPATGDTQMRLLAGLTLFDGRLRLDSDGAYVINPLPGQKAVLDQRWRVEVYSQCCGFLLEYLTRDFSAENSTNDFRFSLDLRGIGKLLDHQF